MSAGPAALRLSRRVRALEPVATQAMAQRAKALRAAGREVLDFSVGEPDQDTPAHIVAAAEAALEAGHTRYAPAAGLPELRAAVVAAYRRDFGVAFERDEVVVTTGGKQALYVACQALLGPGDEVLVPTPRWPTFAECVRLAGARVVPVPLTEARGFRLTARAVARVLGPRSRALIVNNPANPTGVSVAPEELLALGRLARRHGLTVLYDDTYAWLQLEARPAGALAQLRALLGERLVVLGTASKTHCMTGWRIGWMVAGRALGAAAAALISHSTQCPATFAQVAAALALAGPQDHVRALVEEYRRRLALCYPALLAIPGVSCVRPDGGFYLFPNVRPLLSKRLPTTAALAERLLEQAGLALVPGEGFDAPGHLRLSFARPAAELRLGLERLAAFLGGS